MDPDGTHREERSGLRQGGPAMIGSQGRVEDFGASRS